MKRATTKNKSKEAYAGFAAVGISTANGLEADFHTTIPRTFLTDKMTPRDQFPLHVASHPNIVKFLRGPISDDALDLVFGMLAVDKYKPPVHWIDTPARVFNYFDKYEESQMFIKDLADSGYITETRFAARSAADVLRSVPALTPGIHTTSPVRIIDNVINYEFNGTTTSTAAVTSTDSNSHENHRRTPATEAGIFFNTFMAEDEVQVDMDVVPLQSPNITQTQMMSKADVTDVLTGIMNKFSETIAGTESRIMEKLNNHERRLVSLEGTLNETQRIADELRILSKNQNAGTRGANLVGYTELTSRHELHLPIQDKESFLKFEEKLSTVKDEKDLFQDLKTYFEKFTSNTTDPGTNIYRIINSFFTAAFLMTCVPKQKTGDKIVFATTKFYTCLLEGLTAAYIDSETHAFSEEVLMDQVRRRIKNAGDKNGGRLNRTRTKSGNEFITHSTPSKRSWDQENDESFENNENNESRSPAKRVLRDVANDIQS